MTFIPDAQQKPRKYRRRVLQPYVVHQPLLPSYAIPEEREEEQSETNKLLRRIIKILDRGYVDQTYALSNTQSSLFLDYKGRKHLYMFSPVALTLNLDDLGTLSVPALTWTDISFKETTQIFTTNQANAVFVYVRATDDLILPQSLPLANPLPVSLPAAYLNTLSDLKVGGDFKETLGLSATGANAFLLPVTDVSAYRYFNMQFTPQTNNLTVTFQQSNDGINFTALTVTRADGVRAASWNSNSGTQGGQFSSPIFFRYLAVQITVFSSGTVAGLIELYTLPISPAQVGASISDTDGNPLRGNQSATQIINASNVSTTQNSPDQVNNSARGVLVYINVTAIGTGSLILHIQGKDVVSGNYVDLFVASAALVANGEVIYELYPGISGGSVTQAVSGVLPKDWRVSVAGAVNSTFFVNTALEM